MAEQVTTYMGAASVITGLGHGVSENFERLMRYESGLRLETLRHIRPEPLAVQRIPDSIFSETSDLDGFTRLERLVVLCVSDILEQSSLDRSRTALIVSTTKGNIAQLGTEPPAVDSPVLLGNTAQKLAAHLGLTATPVVSTACISGVAAIVEGSRLLRDGLFDNVIVVGVDEVSEFVTTGFVAFKSVSASICRPYDARHDGLSLGEAVAAVLLTTDAALSTGIVVEGGALSNDANHISGPSRTGEPLAAAIAKALACNGLTADDIDYVNAHGTATVYNDDMESKALNIAGLGSVPMNSLKPYYGHTLGASGVLETVLCAEQMRRSTVIGTLGFERQGTPMALNVSAEHRTKDIRRCVKTASGFGGTNAAVVLAKQEVARPLAVEHSDQQPTVGRHIRIEDGRIELDSETIFESTNEFSAFIRHAYHTLVEPNMKFFKMDDLSKLAYLSAEILLKDLDLGDPSETAVVLSNRSSSLVSDMQHNRILAQGLPASPAVFVYTLPNVAIGEICIRHKIQGETIFFVSSKFESEECLRYVQILTAQCGYRNVIYGWCEHDGTNYKSDIYICKQ